MKLAGIEYHGSEDTTQCCLEALSRLYTGPNVFEEARLLSSDKRHGFLLYLEYGRKVAIKTGFTSGYPGEGPRGLATALRFLDRLNVKISEYAVSPSIINRLNLSALTEADLEKIEKSCLVHGNKWREYIYAFDLNRHEEEVEFRGQFLYELPLRLIDLRLLDLALAFQNDPDAALMSGFRRLEDALRKRCDLAGMSGVRLFSKVFQGNDALLYWPELDQSEAEGRANLFASVYKGYRNPRAHKELNHCEDIYLREFLLLNELFRLESTAREKNTVSQSIA